jgi:outer membrane protein assembly factor BamA
LTASLVPAFLALVAQLHAGDTIEAVRFAGNRAFPSRLLGTVVSVERKRPATESQLSRDVAALERFYQDQGFFEAQADRSVGAGRRGRVVTFTVSEGPRTIIGSVAFFGSSRFSAADLKASTGLSVGQAWTAAGLQEGVQALRSRYLDAGYPFVEVAVSTERIETAAHVSYRIDEKQRCRVRKVVIRGNRAVRTSTIVRASEVGPGELFSQSRLYAAQRRLYGTRLFSRVAFAIVREDSLSSEVDVRFDVAEQPCRGFAFGAGVEALPVRLLGSVEWEHDNLLNLGHGLALGVEGNPALNGDYRIGVEGRYRVPYLVLTRIDFQTHPFYKMERVDSLRYLDYGVETGMSRSLWPQLTVGLANRLRFFSPSLTGVTNSLGLSAQYDTRNDIFDPNRGMTLQTMVEAAGGWLGGTNDFHRLTLDTRVYQGIGVGFVAAARVMGGVIVPFGRIERAPHYESFTLGGRNSLRGFTERALGPDTAAGFGRYGPTVINANLEVRSPYLLHWVGLVVFADAGKVADRLDTGPLEYCAGVGVRVRTPIGPVRVDWGRRLFGAPDTDKGRLYLGLLHAF